MRSKAHLERLIRVLQKSVERNKHNAMLRRSDLKLIAQYRAELTNKHNGEENSSAEGARPIEI